jgi:hypothetical protein
MTTASHRTTALRQRMLQDLRLAGLSERTQEAYLRAVRQLADHFHTPPDRLTEPQVREYFLHLMNDRKWLMGPGWWPQFLAHDLRSGPGSRGVGA